MSTEPNDCPEFEKLRDDVAKLHSLLSNPDAGGMWPQLYAEKMQAVYDFWACRDAIRKPAVMAELSRLRSLADAGEKVADALAEIVRIYETYPVPLHHISQKIPSARSALAAYRAAKSQTEPSK